MLALLPAALVYLVRQIQREECSLLRDSQSIRGLDYDPGRDITYTGGGFDPLQSMRVGIVDDQCLTIDFLFANPSIGLAGDAIQTVVVFLLHAFVSNFWAIPMVRV